MKINQLKSHLNTENARPPHRRNSLKFNRDSTQKFRWDSTQVWISIKPVGINTKVVGMCIKAPPWSSVLVGKTTCAKSVRISTRFVGMCTKAAKALSWSSIMVGISTKSAGISTRCVGICTTSPPCESVLVGISNKWHDKHITNPEFQYLICGFHEQCIHTNQERRQLHTRKAWT